MTSIEVPDELVDVVTGIVDVLKRKYNYISCCDDDEEEKKVQRKEEEWPPAKDRVFAYIRERNSSVNPDRFWNWMVNHKWHDARGNVIRDWRKKVADWESYNIGPAKKQAVSQAVRKDDTDRLLKLLGCKEEDECTTTTFPGGP